jgi:curli biogenesis system outer membrane secretion channel CsgG
MHTSIALLFAAALAAPSALLAAEPEVAPPRLAVVRPTSKVVLDWWNGSGAAERVQDRLIGALASSQKYQVLDRDLVTETLAREKVLLSGELSPGGAIRVGRELGVRYVAAGTLIEFGTSIEGTLGRRKRKLFGLGGLRPFRVEFVLRLHDVETGASLWSSGRLIDVPRHKPGESKEPAEVEAWNDKERNRIFGETLIGLVGELAEELAAADVALEQPSPPEGD